MMLWMQMLMLLMLLLILCADDVGMQLTGSFSVVVVVGCQPLYQV